MAESEVEEAERSSDLTEKHSGERARLEADRAAERIADLEASRTMRAGLAAEMAGGQAGSISAGSRLRPIELLGGEAFDREVKARGIGVPERGEVLGITERDTGRALVRDAGDTAVTAVHERYHQFSADAVRELEEGIAEHLARERTGWLSELASPGPHGGGTGSPEVYEVERRVAAKLEAAAGRERIEAALLDGDRGGLRAATDAYFGPGTFDEVIERMAKGRPDEADGLLVPGAPKKGVLR
ncbi:MAG: hypothetical protein HZB56_22775 [Deltaproteobacteria bacterium]|nr:hypothetical protein [Deltaproteobacteria bacterium]